MTKVPIKKSELVWDAWNIQHIWRHKVEPFEVEEAITRQIRVDKSYKGRLMIFGETKTGRILAIILEREESNYYVLTARSASRRERRKL